MPFELLVAIRYLKAKRKQAVISLITIISVLGVTAGVAALVIALAMSEGFREYYLGQFVGVRAHVSLERRTSGEGISDYVAVADQVEGSDGVIAAAPSVYLEGLVSNAARPSLTSGARLKGVLPEREARLSSLSQRMLTGSLSRLDNQSVILGKAFADRLGVSTGERVDIVVAGTGPSRSGSGSRTQGFDVAGVFESGLNEPDSTFVYVTIDRAQQLLGMSMVASSIEVKVRDVDKAPEMGKLIVEGIGHDLKFTDWQQQNRSVANMVKVQRLILVLTIGLIAFVAVLNIVSMLIMMVAQKGRDIAILMSMGAKQSMIRRIFIYQGSIIGVIGTLLGLVLGHSLSYIAETYKLVRLPEVYGAAYVPFRAQFTDSIVISVVVIAISFLATLYPSAAAASVHPIDALRYE